MIVAGGLEVVFTCWHFIELYQGCNSFIKYMVYFVDLLVEFYFRFDMHLRVDFRAIDLNKIPI